MTVLYQFSNNIKLIRIELVKHVLQCVLKTLQNGKKFNKKMYVSNKILWYTDSNFSCFIITQKLILSYVFISVIAKNYQYSKFQFL